MEHALREHGSDCSYCRLSCVLILIVMEHALRATERARLLYEHETVLILIVMEHALRAAKQIDMLLMKESVLILIVMEHALREEDYYILVEIDMGLNPYCNGTCSKSKRFSMGNCTNHES